MIITYKDRQFLDRFRCIDKIKKVSLFKTWKSGGLLYGYKNEYQVISLDIDFIISIEEEN